MGFGSGADMAFLGQLSSSNFGEAADLTGKTDEELLKHLNFAFKAVQHGIFSTHNKLEIISDCVDQSTFVNDIDNQRNGVKFMDPNRNLIELANVEFKKDLAAEQPCEVLINYAATVKNEEISESAKLCFPGGPRGSHQRWHPSKPCPSSFTAVLATKETPSSPFIKRMRLFR